MLTLIACETDPGPPAFMINDRVTVREECLPVKLKYLCDRTGVVQDMYVNKMPFSSAVWSYTIILSCKTQTGFVNNWVDQKCLSKTVP